jgi:hypothetical protein
MTGAELCLSCLLPYGFGPVVNGRPVAWNPRRPSRSTRASIPLACSASTARVLVASFGQPQ